MWINFCYTAKVDGFHLVFFRYVNRKGVALPTSSEETKKSKRECLDQKQGRKDGISIRKLLHVGKFSFLLNLVFFHRLKNSPHRQ